MKATMTKILVLLCLNALAANAQTWQWGRQGGADDQLNTNAGNRQEEVTHIATDSENNIYVISSIGMTNPEIDGNPKINYGDPTTKADYAIASFACDGTYRWSKVIGGLGFDLLHSVYVDNDDNVYVAGIFGGSSGPVYAHHIDEDVVFPSSPTNHQRLILIKYNKDGVLQWYRKPQSPDVTSTVSISNTSSHGYAADDVGNSYWLVWLPPGTYADGAFVNTMEGSNFFILKYDAAGAFINATYIDMELGGSTAIYMKFFRNPNNGNYYFTTIKPTNVEITVNGSSVTHSTFLACFDAQGQFLWNRENTGTMEGTTRIQSMVFDAQNNIYLNARMIGTLDSFAGFSFPQSIASMAVMKLDPEANAAIWATYYNHNGANLGAVALNGDELGYAGYGFSSNFTWGSQSIFVSNNNEGTEVLLARFNRDNGDCISLSKIPGDVGYNDYGTALTVDSVGNYIVGGGFSSNLYFGEEQLDNDGLQTDFFVAKFGTDVCQCSAPVPAFGFVPTEIDNTLSFTYTGDAFETISWDFGDESEASAEANPIHTYAVSGTYTACVTVTNNCGSEEVCQEVNAALGVDTHAATNIKVYPNPVKDVLTIITDEELRYHLYSITGSIIQSGSIDIGETNLNVDMLDNGFYMLKLQSSAGTEKNIKLLKN